VVSIVGTDESSFAAPHQFGCHLWAALIKFGSGDRVVLQLPGGTEDLTVLEVVTSTFCGPFREPPWIEASAKDFLDRR